MEFNYIKSRDKRKSALEKLREIFGDKFINAADAEYISADNNEVFGVVGLPFAIPVSLRLLNTYEIGNLICGNTVIIYGDNIKAFSEQGEIVLSENAKDAVKAAVEEYVNGVGTIGENGEHIINLKGSNVGPHYNVNLLLGNRIGFDSPLISTPKAAIDSFGRGSFRADASRQVLATRYDLRFENNGEPTNRQFYVFENNKQVFYSANVDDNVKEAVCKHFPNRTVITYETECGLKIKRTIFVMPQEEDMPEAIEAQRVEIENVSGKDRRLKIVFTGTFGLVSPESMMNDLVYASVTHEGGVTVSDGKVYAVSPNSYPKHLYWQKRFALLFLDGEPMDEYTESYSEFFGRGTLEYPENAAHLSSKSPTKLVPFFAMAKAMTVKNGETKTIDEFVGFTPDRTPDLQNYKKKLGNFIEKYRIKENTTNTLNNVIKFISEYSSYLKLKSSDDKFDSYVNNNLPFQVLYQSFVSRSFAWTQKAFREIGFREIQDMYASVYYMCAMGNSELAKSMLSRWISNVFTMGYANHNFYSTGKEPGICSDDGLWLIQAIYKYISMTADVGILNEEFDTADGGRRTLFDTLDAIVTYSGKISVGEHGFPLMDKADWNDTMKLDDDWISGPEKEKLYFEQLKNKNQKYGVKFDNNLSESVMNAFLLKINLDQLAKLARISGRNGDEYEKESADLTERLRRYAWVNDFYARAMIGKNHETYTYLGADGDGLSDDENINGTYFLNSFSWSILADVSTDKQIEIMLDRIKKYLWTDAGLKLCTPAALEKLANGTAAGHYFPGDRENGGVFKHAAMMAVAAMLKAAKKVEKESLAKELVDLAFNMISKTLPYKALDNPYILKGNPRFCTQYNNSDSGEHCGPMLSGTASWLSLVMFEMLGIDNSSDGIRFNPILSEDMTNTTYFVNYKNTEFEVEIIKEKGFFRNISSYTLDGAEYSPDDNIAIDGKKHNVSIIFK